MNIDYSYLRAQLRTMPSKQKCNGYQLYFFEQSYEKKKSADLSLQILDMWNSMSQEEKDTYQQKEQTLLLDVRSKEESPRKPSTSRSALRSTSKSQSSHSKKKTVHIQVDEQSPKVLQEKEQFSGSQDQKVAEKEETGEKEQINEQDKQQANVQVFEQVKDTEVKDEQQVQQVNEKLLQQTQVIQQVEDQVKEDHLKEQINPEDDAEVQQGANSQGQGYIVQNTEQIVEMLYQQANKGESKSEIKTTSQQQSSQKEEAKFQIKVHHVELDKQEGDHSKSSNKSQSQLKDEVQPNPSKSPSKGKHIPMEKVSPKKEIKRSPLGLIDEGEIVQMARSGKMSGKRSDKSSSKSIGKKSNKRFIEVQKETSPQQKRSGSRKNS